MSPIRATLLALALASTLVIAGGATTKAANAAEAAPAVAAAETPDQDPVIFVHGLYGSTSNFFTMQIRLFFDGYGFGQLHPFGYSSTGSMLDAADQLAAEVDTVLASTGADRVDIVTHSLGGLPSRWYVKFLGGTETVDDWISLGGPNLGGDPGTCPAPGSVACEQATKGSSFITQLNSGDQTPGDVSYTTFSSPCDDIVDQSWTPIEGALNNDVGCISHFNLVSDAGVYQGVLSALET